MDHHNEDGDRPREHKPNWIGLLGTRFCLGFLILAALHFARAVPSDPDAQQHVVFMAADQTGKDTVSPTSIAQLTVQRRSSATPRQPIDPSERTDSNIPVAVRPVPALIPAQWLGLIYADRLADGKNPVAWDDLAAHVATAHARETAEREYLSHWNLAGVGPDVRYGLAGGRDLAQENVYSYWTRYPDGTPGPINLEDQLRAAELALMNSPGHRANILDPVHTQVGVGYHYVASRGELRVAQLFINRYVLLDAVPTALALGAQLTIAGAASDAVSNIIIDVAWRPFPSPLTVVGLGKKPNSYAPDAKSITQFGDAMKTIYGRFAHTVVLGVKPGYYHIRVFGDDKGAQHAIANVFVESR